MGNQDRWQCLRNGTLRRETESLICAAQEQAIQTNLIKGKIDKSQQQTKCKMCSSYDETINHIESECSKLVQKEFKRRHDWIGRRIHGEIGRANGIQLNRNGMSIIKKRPLRITLVKSFGIFLYRQTIL